jgi:hypothetical protein
MECGYEYGEFRTKFGEIGENHLFLLLRFINPTSFELGQQILEFCKEILDIVEDFWIQCEQFHLQNVSPHLILFAKKALPRWFRLHWEYYKKICEKGDQEK